MNVRLAYVLSTREVSQRCALGSVLLNMPIHDLEGE